MTEVLAQRVCDDGTKTCSKCMQEKSFSSFSKQAAGKNGLRASCKECTQNDWKQYVESNAEKRKVSQANYRSNNQEKIRLTDAAYREKNKERELARGAAWRAANPEKEKARTASYRARNKEKDAARKANYAKQNPDVVRAIAARRRARVRGADGTHTRADIQNLFLMQRGLCAACHVDISCKNHVDHIMPLALGGSNDKTNLQLLCPACNHAKSSKHPVDFMRQKGFLL